MLHILWMIIKFILIVIGVLLALLLLALLLILFCPVRYRAAVAKEDEDFRKIRAEAAISWLFHGVSVKIRMEEQQLSHSIRIFGIPLEKLTGIFKKRKQPIATPDSTGKKESSKAPVTKAVPKTDTNKETEKIDVQEQASTAADEQQATRTDEQATAANKQEAAFTGKQQATGTDEQATTANEQETACNGKQQATGTDEQATTADEQPTTSTYEQEIAPSPEPKAGIFTKIRNRIYGLLEKLKGLRKIPETFRKIALTIRNIYAKIDWWKQFLTHPRTKEAISLVRGTLVRLLKHVFPTRIEGNLTFGSEDPSITGTVLALLGITMPLHKNCVEVCPVFEGTNVLEGNVRLKGRIYGIVFLKAAIQIYFNKNIKYVINRWKHKEGNL